MVVVFKHVHEQVPGAVAGPRRRCPAPSTPWSSTRPSATRPTGRHPPPSCWPSSRRRRACLPPEPLDLTQPTQVLGCPHDDGAQPRRAPRRRPWSRRRTGPRHRRWTPPRPAAPRRLLVARLAAGRAPGGPVTLIAGATGAYLGIRAHNQNANSPGADTARPGTPTQRLTTTAAATTVAMPDFTGKTEADADALAAANQLAQPTYAAPQYDAHEPNGTVMDQRRRAADAGHAPARPVAAHAEQGPRADRRPRSIGRHEHRRGGDRAAGRHLDLGKHPSEYDADPGRRARSSPSRRTGPAACPAPSIDVVVSKGPRRCAVPDESGKSLDRRPGRPQGQGLHQGPEITRLQRQAPTRAT